MREVLTCWLNLIEKREDRRYGWKEKKESKREIEWGETILHSTTHPSRSQPFIFLPPIRHTHTHLIHRLTHTHINTHTHTHTHTFCMFDSWHAPWSYLEQDNHDATYTCIQSFYFILFYLFYSEDSFIQSCISFLFFTLSYFCSVVISTIVSIIWFPMIYHT